MKRASQGDLRKRIFQIIRELRAQCKSMAAVDLSTAVLLDESQALDMVVFLEAHVSKPLPLPDDLIEAELANSNDQIDLQAAWEAECARSDAWRVWGERWLHWFHGGNPSPIWANMSDEDIRGEIRRICEGNMW